MDGTLIFLLQYLLPIFILGLTYFFCIFWPMHNSDLRQKILISTLKVGDKIVTKSGIIGTLSFKFEKSFVINSFEQSLIEIEIDSVHKKL